LHPDCLRLLLSEKEIQERVAALGEEISRRYAGREILAVAVLKGAAVFLADLVRKITVPASYDFMAVSSYGSSAVSSGKVRVLKDLDASIEGRHVLLVEDVVDTGITLSSLVQNLKARRPATLEVCALLDKPSRRVVPVEIHYLGFSIPNEFVVGYGLDYNERYRNLPYIAVLDPKVYRDGE